MLLGKSNSILTKTSPTNHSSMKLSKSPPKILPANVSRTPTEIQTEQSSHSRLQETPLKEAKKFPVNELQEKSRDISQNSDSFATNLDRHTFYSTNFSLFDNRTNSTRHNLESPQSKPRPAPQLVSPKHSKETPEKTENFTEKKIPSKTLNIARFSSSSKPSYIENLVQSSSPTVKLKRPDTTKQTKTPSSKGLAQTAKTFFNTKTLAKSKTLTSPSNKRKETVLKASPQPVVNIDSIEEAKANPQSYDPILINSATLTTNALYRENPGNIVGKKNALAEPESSDKTKYNKIFKGLDNKSSLRFAPERYKRLGKGIMDDNGFVPQAGVGQAAQKAAYKAQRRIKGAFLSHGDMFFIENSLNKVEKKEGSKRASEFIQKKIGRESIKQSKNPDILMVETLGTNSSPQNIEQFGSPFIFESNLKTYNSIEQGSSSLNEFEVRSRTKSIVDSGTLSRGVESIGEIEAKYKPSKLGPQGNGDSAPKQNDYFEEFFNNAMNYMSELIESKDPQATNQALLGVKDHEEYLNSLFDHIVKEINYLRKEEQDLPGKMLLGKKILVLLDMGLRSVGCLVKKKNGPTLKRVYNRSISGKIIEKKGNNAQDWKISFEELYGLEGQLGIHDDNDKVMREKLCKEIEKRRGEIEDLERNLKDMKENKALVFVQGVKAKVTSMLKKNKKK